MGKKSIIVAVLSTALIVATLTVLVVIVGLAKTPPGQVFLATGHYYQDYLQYLGFIAQGLRGHWLPRMYTGIGDNSVYFYLEPYVLFGQLSRLFHFSPIFTYWLSIFIMTVIFTCLIFLVIRLCLKNKPFYLQMTALLITIFMAPFLRLQTAPEKLTCSFLTFIGSLTTYFLREYQLSPIIFWLKFLF